MKRIFVLLVAVLFLFGCVLFEEKKPSIEEAELPPENVSVNVTEEAVNVTEENVTEVEENIGEVVPIDPFAGITPRNISDNIADGQFRIFDMPGEPLEIYVINSGHADSVFVKKGSFTMLIDAGNFDAADEFLKGKGIGRINVVVATRDYSGATGGLEEIIRSYEVDEFWENNAPAFSAEYDSLLSSVEEKNIVVKHPAVGDELEVQELKIKILNPQKERLKGNPDNDAIVMKLSYGAFCAVFLNPTIQERENVIIASKIDLRCPVVTYFKHGEGRPTPSVLIDSYIQPNDVIISVGESEFELPSQKTLTWLKIRNIDIWRTDADGTIGIITDGLGKYTIGVYNAESGQIVGAEK